MTITSTIPFIKGQGCFNTFIIFDLIQYPERFTNNFVREAHQILLQFQYDDVLILLPKQTHESIQGARMEILEPDGSFATFCGNGARVIAAYFEYLYGPGQYLLVTPDREHEIIAHGNGLYSVVMGQTLFNPLLSQFVTNATCSFTSADTRLWHTSFNELPHVTWYFAQTGEPHLVSLDQVSNEQLPMLGLILNSEQYRYLFPHGISLNSICVSGTDTLTVHTFERGVNRITMACGTGSTSSALVAYMIGSLRNSCIQVKTNGGSMTITYDPHQDISVMSGPAAIDLEQHELIIEEQP